MKEEALQELEQQLAKCRECKLCEFAKGPVGWFGCAETPIVFVGEGPGGVEDDYGCPLIGPSGQLLDKALWATKMTRDRVITTNIVKCRPKGNRTPNIAEADFCAQLWLEKRTGNFAAKSNCGAGQRSAALFGQSGYAHNP